MAASIPDISVPSDQFVDINTLSGISIGVAMSIQNKGNYNIVLQESVLQPAADSENGVIITNVYEPYARGDVRAGSIKIWARTLGTDVSCKINVQAA